jgi:hypothetical protein
MSPDTSAFAPRKMACCFLVFAFLTFLTVAPVACTQQTEVTLVTLTSPVLHGNEARLTIKTAPKAKCHITVQYKAGPIKAQGLVPKPADRQGRVSWTWRVGAKITPGSWPITVTCSSGGQKGSLKTSLEVL